MFFEPFASRTPLWIPNCYNHRVFSPGDLVQRQEELPWPTLGYQETQKISAFWICLDVVDVVVFQTATLLKIEESVAGVWPLQEGFLRMDADYQPFHRHPFFPDPDRDSVQFHRAQHGLSLRRNISITSDSLHFEVLLVLLVLLNFKFQIWAFSLNIKKFTVRSLVYSWLSFTKCSHDNWL